MASIVLVHPSGVRDLADRLDVAAATSGRLEWAVRARALLLGEVTPAAGRLDEIGDWAKRTADDLRWLADRVEALDAESRITTGDGLVGTVFPFDDVTGARRAAERGARLADRVRAAVDAGDDARLSTTLADLGDDVEELAAFTGALGPEGLAALQARLDAIQAELDAVDEGGERGHAVTEFFKGAWDAVYGTGELLVGLTIQGLWDRDAWGDNWSNLGATAQFAFEEPGEFGKALLDLETLQSNPGRWFGGLAPDVALTLAGGGGAARRVLAGADAAGDAAAVFRRLDNLDELGLVARSAEDLLTARPATPDRLVHELENFVPGTASYHTGPLDEDLWIVQFSDSAGGGSLSWWTSVDQAEAFRSVDDVHEALALLPEWGRRDAYAVARVPEGADLGFLEGRAAPQMQPGTGRVFDGQGQQLLLEHFDTDWVVEMPVDGRGSVAPLATAGAGVGAHRLDVAEEHATDHQEDP